MERSQSVVCDTGLYRDRRRNLSAVSAEGNGRG